MAGFIGWVEFDGDRPQIPNDVVDELRTKIAEIDDDGGHWTRYKPGQQVRVVSGKMESLAEVLEEPKSPNSRVRVLMSFMGGLVPARVPWEEIQSVTEDQIRPPRRTRGRGRWINGFGPRVETAAASQRL